LGVDAEMALRGAICAFESGFKGDGVWRRSGCWKSLRRRNWRRFGKGQEEAGGRGAGMIEIRSCAGFEELEACVQLQVETWGYDASDVVPRKAFRVAQANRWAGFGGVRYRACGRDRSGQGGIAGWFCLLLAGNEDRGRPTEGLSAFAYAGGQRGLTATGVWAGNLSWSNGLRRFREASGIWNGRSIRWKSRTLF